MMVLAAAAVALPTDALACGGFFCNRDFPIDQAGEQVVFGVDEPGGEVTTHVQINYQGASEDFAWVVPVASQPELFVSSDALFSTLASFTQPQFMLSYDTMGVCDLGWGVDYAMSAGDTDTDWDEEGVTVVAEQQVGPYDTVILLANDTSELLVWLQDAGYDLPDDLEPVLQPYVADGQYFVALKLSAGKDTGDLQPLGMRYPGTAASVPIQLTSIAATPDMRLEVYVLGDARAVPDNYLHVWINEAAINWFDAGSNYKDVITLAADEAGGHAFATDFSGSTAPFRGMLWNEANYDEARLRSTDDPIAWVEALMSVGLTPSSALLALLMDLIPFPAELEAQGVSPQNFYDCLSCYEEHLEGLVFDGETATDALEAQVIDGLREAEALLAKHDHMTRLTSSLDAIEMTVDPMFVFNRDLPQEQSNVHRASLEYHCGTAEGWDGAERTLVLSDGRAIQLPSEAWFEREQITEFEYLGDLRYPAAILIEDLGAEGAGEILFDYREQAAEEARRFGAGCAGCATGSSPVGALGILLGALGLARRRRS